MLNKIKELLFGKIKYEYLGNANYSIKIDDDTINYKIALYRKTNLRKGSKQIITKIYGREWEFNLEAFEADKKTLIPLFSSAKFFWAQY